MQVDPTTIKPTLKASGTKRLKLKYDEPLPSFAFKFNSRRYTEVEREAGAELAAETARRARRMENQNLAHEAKATELASRLAMLRSSEGYAPGGNAETQLIAARNAEVDAAARTGAALAAAAGGAAGQVMTPAEAEGVLAAARAAARQRRGSPVGPAEHRPPYHPHAF